MKVIPKGSGGNIRLTINVRGREQPPDVVALTQKSHAILDSEFCRGGAKTGEVALSRARAAPHPRTKESTGYSI